MHRRVGRRTQVDHLHDTGAGSVQGNRGVQCAVAAGDYRNAPARQYRVLLKVAARGTGKHDSRPVIAGEHQRLLDRSGGQHDFAGAYLPEAFARRARLRRGEMVAEPFADTEQIVREVAEGRAARQ